MDISHHISQLHVSARFYGDLVFKKTCQSYTIPF